MFGMTSYIAGLIPATIRWRVFSNRSRKANVSEIFD